jgi:hypothetical protein
MKFAASLLSLTFLAGCSSVKDEAANADIVADLTKGVSDVCPLHHKRMKKTAALVHYRFISSGRGPAFAEYDKAQKSLFPFGETIYTSLEPSPTGEEGINKVWLYVCEDCRVVGDAWREEWRYGKKG